MTILSLETMETTARGNLMLAGKYITKNITKANVSDVDLEKDIDLIIESAYEEPDFYDLLANYSDKESFAFYTEIEDDDYLITFNSDGEVTHEVNPPEEDDDSDIDRAWRISEAEGRPFDHVMGEILGGLR